MMRDTDIRVMVVGGGGREHAIIKKIKENDRVGKIYALPGNGGIAADAECVDIGAVEIERIVEFAVDKEIDYAIVAPDDPLVAGCVDMLEEAGVECFGPRANAAIIEGSKAFAKDLMKKYGIPTASYEVFDNADAALEYIETAPLPTVIKADGLALGKGVVIAQTREEARDAVIAMMRDGQFGKSGRTVVIEEFLEGPEVSVLSFTDGRTIVPMVSSMDHKRAGDGDTGLNTGGMGTVAPNPYYTDSIARECMEKIFLPTMNAMNRENRTFRGCLYFGLMITKDGPKVIEYNCRFGDPETQVVLPLLKSDLLDIMIATTRGKLADAQVEFSDSHACCVIEASEGYPVKYDKGYEILSDIETWKNVYVAGAKLVTATEAKPSDMGDLDPEKVAKWQESVAKTGVRLVNWGGRVLGCTAVAETLEDAVKEAYGLASKVRFENAYYRKDIGARALKAGTADQSVQ